MKGKINRLQSRKVLRPLVMAFFGGWLLWMSYDVFLQPDDIPDPEPHWGEWILVTLLAGMLGAIAIMLAIKFWPSNWENDPDNNQVQVREGMRIFDN